MIKEAVLNNLYYDTFVEELEKCGYSNDEAMEKAAMLGLGRLALGSKTFATGLLNAAKKGGKKTLDTIEDVGSLTMTGKTVSGNVAAKAAASEKAFRASPDGMRLSKIKERGRIVKQDEANNLVGQIRSGAITREQALVKRPDLGYNYGSSLKPVAVPASPGNIVARPKVRPQLSRAPG